MKNRIIETPADCLEAAFEIIMKTKVKELGELAFIYRDRYGLTEDCIKQTMKEALEKEYPNLLLQAIELAPRIPDLIKENYPERALSVR